MKKRFLITEKQLKFIVDNFDVLNEQEKRKLPTIDFNNSFLDNMVKVYQNDNLTNALSELDQNILEASEKNEKLKSISITINAGSSTPTATNSLPSGVNKPDHDYDGLLSMEVCKTGKKDKCWLSASRRDERVNITNGNIYLANQRANNLKIYLEQYIRNKYGKEATITINIKDVKQSTTKFASAVIDGLVWVPTEIIESGRWEHFQINRMYPNGPLNYVTFDIKNKKWDNRSAEEFVLDIVKSGLVKGSQLTKNKFGNIEFSYPKDLNKHSLIANELNKFFNGEGNKYIKVSGDKTEVLTSKELYNILNTNIPSLQNKILEFPPVEYSRKIKR